MRLGRAASHRFRLGIRLMPDHFATEPPASLLEGEGEPPRNAYQVFCFQPLRRWRANAHCRGPVLFNGRAIPAIPGRKNVAHVQPDPAIGAQDAPDLLNRLNDARDLVLQAVIAANLIIDLIVP